MKKCRFLLELVIFTTGVTALKAVESLLAFKPSEKSILINK